MQLSIKCLDHKSPASDLHSLPVSIPCSQLSFQSKSAAAQWEVLTPGLLCMTWKREAKKYQFQIRNKLAKLRRHASRVHFVSNRFGPIHFVFVHTSTSFLCIHQLVLFFVSCHVSHHVGHNNVVSTLCEVGRKDGGTTDGWNSTKLFTFPILLPIADSQNKHHRQELIIYIFRHVFDHFLHGQLLKKKMNALIKNKDFLSTLF